VVFAILLVAANTMAMAIRERTSEIGVLKTLGFEDGTIFRLVLDELREGVIVDLHDGYPPRPTSSRTDCTPTVEALDHLLPCLQPEGYEAVTVSQLGTPAAP